MAKNEGDKTGSSTSSSDELAEREGDRRHLLRIQGMIWQEKGTISRSDLEEYADELAQEGLFDDMLAESHESRE